MDFGDAARADEDGRREAYEAGRDERQGRASWRCPDCGPLGYAVLLSGRGGLRGCPLCGGLAEAAPEPACSLCGGRELRVLATLKDGSRYMACESCHGRGLRGPLMVEVVR